MTTKLACGALAAAFALAAGPAMAAGSCPDPGPPPAAGQFPDRPAMPPGVHADQVYQCRPAGPHAKPGGNCDLPPLGPYLKALDAWDAKARAFQPEVKAWQANVDKYAACVEAAVAPFGPFVFDGQRWITAP